MQEPAQEVAGWCGRLAVAMGTQAPSPEETEELLELAGVAAHATERMAAPLSCWLAGRAGVPVSQALAIARGLAAEVGEEKGSPEP